MTQRFRAHSALLTLMLFVLPASIATAQGISPAARDKLSAKYPREQIVASCSGSRIGNFDSFVALFSASGRRIHVVSIAQNDEVRELDTVPALHGSSFELQCMNAKEAKERKQTLRHSEAIRDFLNVPAGRGAVCYFTTDTETKCWSTDKNGKLIDAGGWQT